MLYIDAKNELTKLWVLCLKDFWNLKDHKSISQSILSNPLTVFWHPSTTATHHPSLSIHCSSMVSVLASCKHWWQQVVTPKHHPGLSNSELHHMPHDLGALYDFQTHRIMAVMKESTMHAKIARRPGILMKHFLGTLLDLLTCAEWITGHLLQPDTHHNSILSRSTNIS